MANRGAVGLDFFARDRFSKVSDRINKSVKKVNRTFDASARSSRRVTKAQTAQLGIMRKMRGMIGVAAGAAAARRFVSQASTLETATLKVLSNVSDLDEKARLRPIFEQMIRETAAMGHSFDEVGEALFTQTSQMGTGEKALANFMGGVKLAVGGFAPLQDSISVINKMLENFIDLGGDANKAAAFIFSGQVFGDTNVAKLAQALPMSAAAAAKFGLSAEQYIGIIADVTKPLKGTESAVFAFGTFLETFSKVLPKSTQFDALKKVGLPTDIEKARGFKFQGYTGIEAIMRRILLAKVERPLDLEHAFTERNAKRFVDVLSEASLDRMMANIASLPADFVAKRGLEASYLDVNRSLAKSTAVIGSAFNELAALIGEQLSPAFLQMAEWIRGFRSEVKLKGLGGAWDDAVASGAKSMWQAFKETDWSKTAGDVFLRGGVKRMDFSDLHRQANANRFMTPMPETIVNSPAHQLASRLEITLAAGLEGMMTQTDSGLDVGLQTAPGG